MNPLLLLSIVWLSTVIAAFMFGVAYGTHRCTVDLRKRLDELGYPPAPGRLTVLKGGKRGRQGD